MSYKGITPTPGTDVTKNLKSIYGHDEPLVAVWLMVKEFPAPRRPNMVPPSLDLSHSASRAHDDSKRKGDIHIDMCSPIKKRPTNVLRNSKNVKNKKIHNLHTYVSLVFIMYQFIYNPRVKSIKMPLFFTITDSMKTKTCVNPHTIKGH